MNQPIEKPKRAPKKITIDYSKGKIYKVVNDVNDCVYVGSTTTSLAKRLSAHKSKAMGLKENSKLYASMRNIGVQHFQILLIQGYPCKSKDELEAKEYEILNTFAKDKVLNSIFDGKPNEAEKHDKETKRNKRVFIQDEQSEHPRGFVDYIPSKDAVVFFYVKNTNLQSKSFSLSKYGTLQMGHRAAWDYQNQIYPIDYLKELPFANVFNLPDALQHVVAICKGEREQLNSDNDMEPLIINLASLYDDFTLFCESIGTPNLISRANYKNTIHQLDWFANDKQVHRTKVGIKRGYLFDVEEIETSFRNFLKNQTFEIK